MSWPVGNKHWNWKGGIANTQKKKTALLRECKRKRNGWSKELFINTLSLQNNRCAICKERITPTGKNATVGCADHNHETLQPRGILCRKCNLMLGLASDNSTVLMNAVEYLEKFKVA